MVHTMADRWINDPAAKPAPLIRDFGMLYPTNILSEGHDRKKDVGRHAEQNERTNHGEIWHKVGGMNAIRSKYVEFLGRMMKTVKRPQNAHVRDPVIPIVQQTINNKGDEKLRCSWQIIEAETKTGRIRQAVM